MRGPRHVDPTPARLRKQRLRALGVSVAILLSTLIGSSFLPPVRRHLILLDQRQARNAFDPGILEGYGFAKRSQLHSPELGPMLLRDPAVVEQRLRELDQSVLHSGDREILTKYRGEWALYYAALRLQGKSESQNSLDLTLATLLAEAEPPHWWEQARWLQQDVGVKPSGSFKMGLLTPAVVPPLLAQMPTMSLGQMTAMVQAILVHDDGFSAAQRDEVLKVWSNRQKDFFSPNSQKSLQQVLLNRKAVCAFVGEPGPLNLTVTAGPKLSPDMLTYSRTLVEDFVRSCGYRLDAKANRALQIEVGVEDIDFATVTVDTYVPYNVTENVHVASERKGKYMTVERYEEKVVTKNEHKVENGAAHIVSLTLSLKSGDRDMKLKAPPYGEISQDEIQESQQLLAKPQLDADAQYHLDLYLKIWASKPWRYGLAAFSRDWNVETHLR